MKITKDIKWILLIFIVTLILLARLFIDIRYYGHDTLFHTSNIINLSKTISLSNIFGDNLIKLSTNPFGYGTWLFYPKIPHLLGSYNYLIFKDVYFSMSLVYFGITFLSGIAMFFLSKKLFNCPRVAFLSSLIYLTSSYHICEIYTRDAYAENFIFLIIPVIFLALYELRDNNYNKFYFLFIFGYVIGMYSHLVSMVFCTIFVAIFLLYYRKHFFCKEKIKALFISMLIVTGLVCPFLVSILEHKILGNYIVFTEYFSSKPIAILNIFPISSYFNHDKNLNFNNILVYFNYSTMILFVTTFMVYTLKNNRKKLKDERKFLIYAILLLIMFISSPYLWFHLPNILAMIQFPWRLMIFLCCTISLYAPLCFIEKLKIKKIYYFIFVFIMILEGINNIYYYGKKEYSLEEINSSSAAMGWNLEYFPSKVIDNSTWHLGDFLEDKEYNFVLSDSSVNITIIEDDFPSMQFEIKNINKDLTLEIPRIYYLGYELYDQSNNEYLLYENDYGFLSTKLSKDGIYTLEYVGTNYDKIAKIIRILTIIIIFILVIYQLKNKQFLTHKRRNIHEK